MGIFAGVDIGSTTGKAVLLDDQDRILASTVMEATTRPEKTARMCVDEVLKQSGLKEEDITYMVGTGYGLVKIPEVHIQTGPMDVEIVQKFHIDNVRDSSFLEPRIFLVRQEVLLAPHEKPKSVAVNVQDFNF